MAARKMENFATAEQKRIDEANLLGKMVEMMRSQPNLTPLAIQKIQGEYANQIMGVWGGAKVDRNKPDGLVNVLKNIAHAATGGRPPSRGQLDPVKTLTKINAIAEDPRSQKSTWLTAAEQAMMRGLEYLRSQESGYGDADYKELLNSVSTWLYSNTNDDQLAKFFLDRWAAYPSYAEQQVGKHLRDAFSDTMRPPSTLEAPTSSVLPSAEPPTTRQQDKLLELDRKSIENPALRLQLGPVLKKMGYRDDITLTDVYAHDTNNQQVQHLVRSNLTGHIWRIGKNGVVEDAHPRFESNEWFFTGTGPQRNFWGDIINPEKQTVERASFSTVGGPAVGRTNIQSASGPIGEFKDDTGKTYYIHKSAVSAIERSTGRKLTEVQRTSPYAVATAGRAQARWTMEQQERDAHNSLAGVALDTLNENPNLPADQQMIKVVNAIISEGRAKGYPETVIQEAIHRARTRLGLSAKPTEPSGTLSPGGFGAGAGRQTQQTQTPPGAATSASGVDWRSLWGSEGRQTQQTQTPPGAATSPSGVDWESLWRNRGKR
jgi:hypothetical protein